MINRHDVHVPFRWLVDRREGLLGAPRSDEADRHLASGCVRCVGRAAHVERLVDAISAGPLAPAPNRLIESALALFAESYDGVAAAPSGVAFGSLLFDQRTAFAATLRSAPGDTRRMLWTFDEYELDACLVTVGTGHDLLGQVVALDDSPDGTVSGHVAVRLDVGGSTTVALEPDGRFTFRGLASGPCALAGVVGGRRFLLPVFHLD
jgi:hypothetical protein